MKKQLKIAALLFSLGFGFSASNVSAGFIGPEAKPLTTVQTILKNHYDDMRVTVKGYIIKRLSDDKYLFKDETGEIIVDIDEKYMPHNDITPKTLVKIDGEVDVKRKGNKVEIDVHKMEIVKQQ